MGDNDGSDIDVRPLNLYQKIKEYILDHPVLLIVLILLLIFIQIIFVGLFPL